MAMGKLIVFEGVDASGKATQQMMLAERLRKGGYDVEVIDFPDYNAPIGRAIKDFLFEEYDIDRETASLLYAADRRQHHKRIVEWLKAGKILIADRYLYSNIAFQFAAGISLKWLIDIDAINVPADIVLLMDINPNKAMERKEATDRNERDLRYLAKVRKVYLDMCSGEIATAPKWVKIDADRLKGDVHEDVYNEVLAFLEP